MSEAQKDILDREPGSETTDLQSLLEAANTSEFSLSEGITEAKQAFEKANSFYELVKSSDSILDEQAPDTADLASEETDGYESDEEPNDKLDNFEGLAVVDEQIDDNLIEEAGEVDNPKVGSEVSNEENMQMDEQQDEFINSNNTKLENIELEQKENNSQESSTSAEIIDDNQEAKGENFFESEQEKDAYDSGYKAALDEFEKSMEMEKSSLQNLVQTMFKIGEKFQEKLEELIKMKLAGLAEELIGAQVQEFQESYLDKIEASAGHILINAADMTLELNHTDFELLKSNSNFRGLAFKVSEEADLRRGEFRLIAGSSGFQQKYVD